MCHPRGQLRQFNVVRLEVHGRQLVQGVLQLPDADVNLLLGHVAEDDLDDGDQGGADQVEDCPESVASPPGRTRLPEVDDLRLEEGDVLLGHPDGQLRVVLRLVGVAHIAQNIAILLSALGEVDRRQPEDLADAAGAVEHGHHVLHQVQRDGMLPDELEVVVVPFARPLHDVQQGAGHPSQLRQTVHRRQLGHADLKPSPSKEGLLSSHLILLGDVASLPVGRDSLLDPLPDRGVFRFFFDLGPGCQLLHLVLRIRLLHFPARTVLNQLLQVELTYRTGVGLEDRFLEGEEELKERNGGLRSIGGSTATLPAA